MEKEKNNSEDTDKSELIESKAEGSDTDNTTDTNADATTESTNEETSTEKQNENIEIIEDENGKKIVRIKSIRFKGKRKVNWSDVESYLEDLVGKQATIEDSGDVIHIGSEFPDEYSGSKYTYSLMGTVAKAKANAAQGILEMLQIAKDKHFRENIGDKHMWEAKNGWYRYNSYFELPVYNDKNEIERYNDFHASMLVRHDNDGKLYLYDVLDIKKETSNPLES